MSKQAYERDTSTKNLLKQGTFLTVASLLVRIMGIFYRVPLTNLLGDVGIGTYTDAYQVYVIFLMLSSYCVPTVLAKIIGDRIAKGKMKEVRKAFHVCFWLFLVLGVLLTLGMFFGADLMAEHIYHNPELPIIIKCFSPAILIVTMMSVFRGYFQGLNYMKPSAYSQLLEGFVHAVLSIVLASIMVQFGTTYAVLGAISSTTIAGLVGLILLLIWHYVYKKRVCLQAQTDNEPVESTKSVLKQAAALIIPVFLANAVLEIKDVLGTATFTNIMILKGFEEHVVISMRGIFSGKFSVFARVPIVFGTATAAAMIPSISNDYVLGLKDSIKEKAISGLRIILLIMIPATIGLTILGKPIVKGFFNGSMGGELFWIGSATCIFYSVNYVCVGILQGVNRPKVSMRNSIIACVINVAAMAAVAWFFDLKVFTLAIVGLIFSFSLMLLNLLSVKKYCEMKFSLLSLCWKPVLGALVMGVAVLVSYIGVYAILSSNLIAMIFSLCFGVLVYFFFMINTGLMTEDDLAIIPFGKYLRLFKVR